jgi:glycosyltransferase involved in cell wall biosynthesis
VADLIPGITVVIPTIPPRKKLLKRALASVAAQTLPAYDILVSEDLEHAGAAATRNKALSEIKTEWVAFLDDDDFFLPNHLEVLYETSLAGDADVYYTGCNVINGLGGIIPRQEEWGRFGLAFDADLLRQKSYIPVTSMVRTSLARDVCGFSYPEGSGYEDWGFYLKLLEAGAEFRHIPEVTWVWEHRVGPQYAFDGTHNTSGKSDKW